MPSDLSTKCPSADIRDAEEMCVLFVTRKWAPAMGGMETYSMRLSEELARLTPLEVIALRGRDNGQPPAIVALLAFPLRVARKFWRHRGKITVLHLADMALWPLAILKFFARSPVTLILSAHGTDVAYHRRNNVRGWLYGIYLKLGSRLLDCAKIIANSRATRDVCAETGWHNITVIPLATDNAKVSENTAFDGSHDGTILFAGRLVERKGCGWFINNVLPLLPNTTRLRVAGTLWDTTETEMLDHPQVDYIGNLGRDALTTAYRKAMCVIVPNIEPASGEYEGFGLVAAEAAAAGGLVLAADCGGLKDAVIHGETGTLVKSGDAQAWCNEIERIENLPKEVRIHFLSLSRIRAINHFCWGRVARETAEIYRIKSS